MRVLLAGIAALAAIITGTHGVLASAVRKPELQTLPPLREQAAIVDAWTEERKALIPSLLRKYGVDAWIISQREYAEDTVFWAIKEATQFSARRRTTQLFLADASAGSPSSYTWVDNTPSVWKELKSVLDAHQPSSIALNTASEIAFSGGLHAGERDALAAELGEQWAAKFVLAPMLGVEVVATMVPGRLAWYRKLMETSWAIIAEAFSSAVIRGNETTTADVEWWMRDRLQALNYSTWFQPGMFILTNDDLNAGETTTNINRDDPRAPSHTIHYGDIIHVDFGVTALGLNTDTQHIGWVVPPGSSPSSIPKGFLAGLAKANRLQDIVRSNMKINQTGNAVLSASLAQASREGIAGKIYSHPTGEWGHSAGAVIGMTNLQGRGGVPVVGDLPLLAHTYYSIELYAEHFVPELGRTIKFPLEEDVYWDEASRSWEWVYGQQTEFLFVLPPEGGTAGLPEQQQRVLQGEL